MRAMKYLAVAAMLAAQAVTAFNVDKNATATVTVQGRLGIGTSQATLFTRMVQGSTYNQQDVVFYHGFGDCVLNHEALFEALTSAGYGVVTFDFPGHGSSGGTINDYTIGQIGQMGAQVLNLYNTGGTAVHLVGWSTGGLVVARALQNSNMYGLNNVERAVMFAPGVKVWPLVGNHGFLTADTLSNNPSANVCPLVPISPLVVPLFAADLLANAGMSWLSTIQTPSLVIAAGDTEDVYVMTSGVKNWVVNNQCSGNTAGCTMVGAQCAGAKHELDNEPSPVGDYVRTATVKFLQGDVSGNWGSGCGLL
jgi:alpha-beta hydrolase superfamily lysophospholipase